MKRDEMECLLPAEIEKRSFEIIDRELMEIHHLSPDKDVEHIVKRVIHTTADFSFAEKLYFSPGFIEATEAFVKDGGIHVVTDTSMAMAGINKAALAALGGDIRCYMQDEAVAKEAAERKITRASVSMEYAARQVEEPVFVIGNAPTALVSIYDLFMEKKVAPRLLVAAPVGFVNVIEAKQLIEELEIPMVVVRGRSGGSNVAAAIMNAILYDARQKAADIK